MYVRRFFFTMKKETADAVSRELTDQPMMKFLMAMALYFSKF